MNDIKKHQRVNDILLGPLERPALQWLAEHMPSRVTPDTCTAIGVFGAFLILVSYALTLQRKVTVFSHVLAGKCRQTDRFAGDFARKSGSSCLTLRCNIKPAG